MASDAPPRPHPGQPGRARAKEGREIPALIAFIESRQNMPHAWGRKANDCGAFSLGAIEAQTGVRLLPELDWTSRAGAMRLLKRFGGMEAAIDALLERIPPALAMRGDIAGVVDDALGIHPKVIEGETLVGPGERGANRMKRRMMVVAWSAVSLRRSAGAQPGQPASADREGRTDVRKGQAR